MSAAAPQLPVEPRPMLAGDLPAVLALAAQVPTAPHWPASEFERMLAVVAQEPARRGAWVLGAEPLIGFAMASQVASLAELEAVVIHPDHRGRRHGEGLVLAVVAWARRTGALKLQLELRASNAPALALYRRLRFSPDGTRRGYYHNPSEDALLMSLVLEP